MNEHSNEFYKPAESLRDLQFLEELEQNPNISQRELSHKLGIALGVTNACLKKMARRGWIKIKKIPPRRIGYYLTPHGFAEKSQLTYRFLSNTIHQYVSTKKEIAAKLLAWEKAGIERIAFYGVSDEMEIAYVTLQGVNLKLLGIVDDDPTKQRGSFFNFPIQGPEQLLRWRPDGVLITSVEARERIRKHLQNHYAGLGFQIESL
ncbi:MAG: winged helix-turn-helix transcriptional regulator [candidate division NC10 bacterium]|nr:winged helix-turn-helix transcriptional regulator [candidate division NC10 bacterium]